MPTRTFGFRSVVRLAGELGAKRLATKWSERIALFGLAPPRCKYHRDRGYHRHGDQHRRRRIGIDNTVIGMEFCTADDGVRLAYNRQGGDRPGPRQRQAAATPSIDREELGNNRAI